MHNNGQKNRFRFWYSSSARYLLYFQCNAKNNFNFLINLNIEPFKIIIPLIIGD